MVRIIFAAVAGHGAILVVRDDAGSLRWEFGLDDVHALRKQLDDIIERPQDCQSLAELVTDASDPLWSFET